MRKFVKLEYPNNFITMNNYIFNIHLDEDIIAESIIAASRFIAEQIAVEMYPEAKYVEFVEVY